jgi:hypothetical protein
MAIGASRVNQSGGPPDGTKRTNMNDFDIVWKSGQFTISGNARVYYVHLVTHFSLA